MWKLVWNADIPNKVRSFGWRLACDNLATKQNKCKRNLEIDSTCNICGMADENSFHAVVECTKAHALRDQLRGVWDLPGERVFIYNGPDWLLILLAKIKPRQRDLVLLVFWRAWFLRNDVVHNQGKSSILDSVRFLQNFSVSFWGECLATDDKGKKPVVAPSPQKCHIVDQTWSKPCWYV